MMSGFVKNAVVHLFVLCLSTGVFTADSHREVSAKVKQKRAKHQEERGPREIEQEDIVRYVLGYVPSKFFIGSVFVDENGVARIGCLRYIDRRGKTRVKTGVVVDLNKC
jgi:hypothetical protein